MSDNGTTSSAPSWKEDIDSAEDVLVKGRGTKSLKKVADLEERTKETRNRRVRVVCQD